MGLHYGLHYGAILKEDKICCGNLKNSSYRIVLKTINLEFDVLKSAWGQRSIKFSLEQLNFVLLIHLWLKVLTFCYILK